MDALDLANRLANTSAHAMSKPTDPTALVTESQYTEGNYEVSNADIVKYLKTNVKFKMAVITHMAYSVGSGFYTTAANNAAGKKAKQTIDDFNEEWDLDTLNQLIGIDTWASGNAFLNTVPQDKSGKGIGGLYMMPLSSIQRINRNKKAQIESYLQVWSGRSVPVPASDVKHHIWLPLDGSSMGEGIGQILARSGIGYKTMAGNTVKRASWFQMAEMIDDVSAKTTYAGLPRYFAYFEGENATDAYVKTAKTAFNKLDPMQNFVTNVKGDVKTIALDTQNKFDSFIRHIQDNIVTGLMSPLIRLWSSLDFTYASSKEAIKAMDPLIGMYQRHHKRFLESMIFTPVLEYEDIEVKKADLRLHWGEVEKVNMDDIEKAWNILKDPKFDNMWDPKNIIDMLVDAGIPITPSMEKAAESTLRVSTNAMKRIDGGRSQLNTQEIIEMHQGRILKVIQSHMT